MDSNYIEELNNLHNRIVYLDEGDPCFNEWSNRIDYIEDSFYYLNQFYDESLKHFLSNIEAKSYETKTAKLLYLSLKPFYNTDLKKDFGMTDLIDKLNELDNVIVDLI